ncbi:unnamed protein product [Dovyalis caffra]|uniref:Uncharacterized protein n=1 Tax=Dovyalis caffra TaxID=77055 RepID=A0AAV1SPZ5_9ROSI|nr:unnamed protein product [Dovyalis caffra]
MGEGEMCRNGGSFQPKAALKVLAQCLYYLKACFGLKGAPNSSLSLLFFMVHANRSRPKVHGYVGKFSGKLFLLCTCELVSKEHHFTSARNDTFAPCYVLNYSSLQE